jgi:hypothetical protein
MATTPHRTTATCPYCLTALEPQQQLVVCPGCGFTHHQECWEDLGGCAVEGCPRMVEVKKAAIPANFWGATEKTCPYCAERIPMATLQCIYCRAVFEDIRPVAREDVLSKFENPRVRELRSQAKRLFVFSVLGVTSPFALLFGWYWYVNNRQELERVGGNTRALALIGLGICVLYVLMLALGILVFTLGRQS